MEPRERSDHWPKPRTEWPEGIWSVAYASTARPSDHAWSSWLEASNCQRFAYGVLSLFGRECPPLRSSNLWDDTTSSVHVREPAALDLVLFNATDDSFGAHIGVWMAPDEVLHLCKEIGTPSVWSLTDFAKRPRYRVVVGFKRVVAERTRSN
jgi:hypothetical protein